MNQLLEIRKIRIDAGTQSRQAISEETVSDYCEFLEEGDLPPVTVYFDGLSYYLADGFHRVLAYKRAGREFIDATVKGGTVRDAVRFSLSANSSHGLRRSIEDKRKAVKTALDDPEWSEMSDREIAKMCAVSHTFVASMRGNVATPKESKPAKLNTVIEAPLEVATLPDEDEYVNEVVTENERLKDRLAVEAMDASDEEKTMAKETIESLRAEIRTLTVELEAVKRSRDQYQMENNELKKQIKMLQRKAK